MPKLTELKAKPAASGSSKGACRRVTIEAAQNGFTVSCDYEPGKGSKSEMMDWRPPKPFVAETLDGALEHARREFGGQGKTPAKDGTPAHEKAESKGKEKPAPPPADKGKA